MMQNKRKSYWYVLVIQNGNCAFVTGIDNRNRMSYWNTDETPKIFSRSGALSMVFGLRINGYRAFAVCHPYVLEDHLD